MSIKKKNSIFLLMIALLISFSSKSFYKAAGEISGFVTNGVNTIPFARVRVQATSILTITDYNGNFTLQNITSTDTLIVTAWATGYYNGETHAVVGDTGVIITLHPLPTEDNPDYEWISPEPDSSETMRCGNCHAEVLMNQWRNNAHGNSATNPFFLAMYYGTDINGNTNKGVGYKLDFDYTQGNCATCHIPGAAVHNPYGIDPKEVTGASRHGVFCDFCHKIYRVLPSIGQGTTGVLSIELLRPQEGGQMFFGPFDDIHEPDSYLPLIRRSEFCAPCHTGKFWGIPAYNCFPEWQESPYPSMGIECQTCHMYPDSVTTNFAPGKGGLERAPFTIPSHLQPGSRDPEILANSVTMNMSAEQIRDSVKVMVTVYNDKTGHHVPTGRPSRNMLLLVTAEDNTSSELEFLCGETIPRWGGVGDVNGGNYSGLSGKGFAKILEDFNGNSPSPSWRPSRILSDNRIAAFETDTSYYYFKVPFQSQNISISAQLIYRRFFKPWMTEKEFDIPDITMENKTLTLLTTSVKPPESKPNVTDSYWLGQNYPNPFNSATTIRFKINKPQHVYLTIFDITGKKVKTIVDNYVNKGEHKIHFYFSGFASGVYVYRLKTESFQDYKKFVYLK